VLQKYFQRKHNVVAERYKFRHRAQNQDEAMYQYATVLHDLIRFRSCDFGALESDMLKDQIVEKCVQNTLCEKFLAQENLTLEKTLHYKTRTFETARSEAKVMTSASSSLNDRH
jgi:hypothetical protein